MTLSPSPRQRKSPIHAVSVKTSSTSNLAMLGNRGGCNHQRELVLPKEARALAARLKQDPTLAREFLIRAGIITKSGRLSRNYR